MRKPTLTIAAVLACAALPALAQDAAQPPAPSRYSFNRVDDGFLRLDNTNGQVAFCSPHTVGWACQAVPEDRAALEKEIARLQDEVASLKQEVANLREPPPTAAAGGSDATRPKMTMPGNYARTSNAPGRRSKMPGGGWSR